MTLQVTHVASPAAGVEWRYVVPAQWVLDVVAVTATLTTTAPPVTAVDSGPGGNNGTYSGKPNINYAVPGPFGAGGGAAAQETVSSRPIWLASNPNAGGTFDVPTFSVDAVINFTDTGQSSMNTIAAVRTSDVNRPQDLRFIFGTAARTPGLRIANTNNNVFSLPGGGFSANVWHHVGFSYDGAQWIGYVDGVAGTPVAGNAPVFVADKPYSIGGDLISSQNLAASIAAVAYYSGALAAARFAAHQAAIATSAAAYKAAVLADSPIALWMLDENVIGGARQAILEVTDGTNSVGDYAGTANAGTGQVFVYTWASQAPGSAISPDGSTNFIQIPNLILPGGYTLGSLTPSMKATDTWSNIAIWWDDSQSVTPGGPGGGNPGDFAPVILLPSDWQGFP